MKSRNPIVLALSITLVALGSVEAAGSPILAKPDAKAPEQQVQAKPTVKATKPLPTAKPIAPETSGLDTSWSEGDPSLGVAAALEVVRATASHTSTRTKKGAKVRPETFARVVETLDAAIVLCDRAITVAKKAKKTKASQSRAAELSSLRNDLVAKLTLAKQARDEQSAAKLGKLASGVSSKQSLRLAKQVHPNAELMVSAVALRLVLAKAIDAAANAKGTNAVIGEKGINAVIGEKGSNAVIGEKGSNAVIGEKGLNALVGENGSNAVIGEKGSNAVIGEKGLIAIDADLLAVARLLLDEVAKGSTLVSKAKPHADQLAGVRDAVSAAAKGHSAWAVRRALVSAEWANEALIAEMQKP